MCLYVDRVNLHKSMKYRKKVENFLWFMLFWNFLMIGFLCSSTRVVYRDVYRILEVTDRHDCNQVLDDLLVFVDVNWGFSCECE